MIDTHTHIYEKAFDGDRREMICRAKAVGVTRMILPSCNMGDAGAVAATCGEYPETCFALYGLHPTEFGERPMEEAERLMEFGRTHQSVGVGEIGLDLHWDKSRQSEQVEVLRWQLEYAHERSLPVSIHCREAVWLLMEILEGLGGRVPEGSLHCFAGSVDEAKVICKKWPQLMFGFGGSSTYKNSKVARVATVIPRERILIETDAPYLTPVPHRGERNEPSYIPLVVRRLAEELGIEEEEVGQLTHDNAMRLFFGSEIKK